MRKSERRPTPNTPDLRGTSDILITIVPIVTLASPIARTHGTRAWIQRRCTRLRTAREKQTRPTYVPIYLNIASEASL